MTHRLDWDRDARDWPHRERSRFIDAAGLRWHLQHWPAAHSKAPTVLLLHGTGASTHSWRALAPLLARDFSVLSIDLPGHAFTSMPPGGASSAHLSMPGMAQAVASLLQTLQMPPALLVGHSAGAAIALRMSLDGLAAPRLVIGLNAALLPLRGLAGQLFSPVAKIMAATPLVPRLFAWRAHEPAVLHRLLESTGSRLDAEGVALYGRLVGNAGHAAGALGMMANWDLQALSNDLARLRVPLDLVVGSRDHTVPPAQAERVLARLPANLHPTLTRLQGLGHLAHEEKPEQVARLIVERFLLRQ